MSTPDSRRHRKTRHDGWTPERQLRFLDALSSARSIRTAAASAGMSREGAYRFRNRSEGTLFALLWERALASNPVLHEVHTRPLTNGRLLRLLGNHYRRKSGEFRNIGVNRAKRTTPDRTSP
jgi:hypothetical protein